MQTLNLNALHALSLRRTLLLVLIPVLLMVGAAGVWQTWRTAVGAANAAYDRSLLGAIKAMDANISTASGGLGVELPYRLLEFFELTANGRVYYRVATEDGLVEIGNADLPPPPYVLVTERPQFIDASYYGDAVRVGSYARLLDPPLAGQAMGQRVVIQIAETLESRQAFTRTLVLEAVARDLLLLIVAIALMTLAVGWALLPLARLRNEVQARSALDLTPIVATGVPADVQPLVQAINHHIERGRQQTEARQRFVDDASHQLRTPLATLSTQVGFALREQDPAHQREALSAIKTQLEEMVRQTNQMLALARVDSAGLKTQVVDASEVVERATREWWPDAREHGVDLGFEPDTDSDTEPLRVLVDAAMLKEALSNLLHNAIRYTPRGGQVTVQLTHSNSEALITVVDNGPGLPPQERTRAGDRFFRGSNASQPGTGLGLAIVRSIAERHGGQLRVHSGINGQGLAVAIVLPRIRSTG
ncbi:MAG: sensor histidine kinase [Gammaproteobacteria bacterium]|uniref:sensor histidine kinase n=1 Tax=Rhodoferax sp. TaxID=50421 RepID=UPI0018138E6D|nr:sensor histidine kinase [Rhodoferax sp.]MBU3898688.1 sensor histidine kinase [Gammaproteobacteria bacterium]MBA3058207.1 sensor histidine kinase [Rhodoferax sp.]MBU3998665.1 sensor histidine kinase [Gammaproteobacteria bacterium]MBU4019477.1 sensor histidine kinase [Gammaproteobacteria bacterium]MBU4079444.1 sensor histidine kinase [Gammaproteobacteria bacterium]